MANKDLKEFLIRTELKNQDVDEKYVDTLTTHDFVYLLSEEEIKKLPKEIKVTSATDFAIMGNLMLHSLITKTTKKKIAPYFSRSPKNTNWTKVSFISRDFSETEVNRDCIGLRPAMQLDVNKVASNLHFFEINEVCDNSGTPIYQTIEFGEYPNHYVGNDLNIKLLKAKREKRLTTTGRTFTGFENQSCRLSPFQEYLYEGEKYIYINSGRRYDEDSILENGTRLSRYEEENKFFVKVEPIKWIILNWEDMPTLINPEGIGSATAIKVISEECINAGIPFFRYADADEYSSNNNNVKLWQNSELRAFLNGCNIKSELLRGNGDIERKTKKNFDLTGKGFLAEAFCGEIANYVEYNDTKALTIQVQERRNPFKVNVNDAPLSVKDQMKFYIENGRSFMLHGPSGVGKTRRVQECDPQLVMLQLRNGMLPEEIIGKTAFNETTNTSSWIEPTWYTKLCQVCKDDPEHYHVLFIDELTNVRETEQSLVFHIVLEHSIEGGKGVLPANCVVIAAGNSPDESSAAYNMPEPLFRRFVAHIELKPNLKEWLEWGSELKPDETPKIHPLVAAFVSANADKVFYTKYDPDKPPKFAIDPRGWEQVSDVIYLNHGELRLKMIADKIGEDNAKSFIGFARKVVISVEDIMDGTYKKSEIPKTLNEKYALTCSLRRATESQVEKVRDFIENELGSENKAIFDSMWIGEDDERALLIDEIEENKRLAREFQLEENKKQSGEMLEDRIRAEAQAKQQAKKEYKITIDEFWASSKELAIHTPTKEQSDILRKVFDKMGKKWSTGNSYLEWENWDNFKENTCYSNMNRFNNKKIFKIIYQFDEVDMEKYLDDENEDEM